MGSPRAARGHAIRAALVRTFGSSKSALHGMVTGPPMATPQGRPLVRPGHRSARHRAAHGHATGPPFPQVRSPRAALGTNKPTFR